MQLNKCLSLDSNPVLWFRSNQSVNVATTSRSRPANLKYLFPRFVANVWLSQHA